jgi:hypothetical protein
MKTGPTAIALTPTKRIAVVLGEQALRTRRGTARNTRSNSITYKT